MAAEEVLYEKKHGIAVITINRPEKHNALNLSTCLELQECWRRVEQDETVNVAVVTGAGEKAFCAGFDITEKRIDGRPRTEDFTPRLGTSCATGKPLITAVNGLAMAAGVALVEACDLCVASENAWFSFPEAKLGISVQPFVQSLWTLPQRILLELLMTGARLTAQRAFELGFINRLAPPGGALEVALELAETIGTNAPLVVRATKGMIYGGHRALGMEEALAESARLFEPVSSSADAKEGFRAWSEKRPPVWKGR